MRSSFIGFLLLIILLSLPLRNQAQLTALPDTTVLTEYKQQSRQLVRFLQFVMNTLGDPQTSAREKDIIINQSYLKIFQDPDVQIEDDLLEFRSVVTNKDVQAYLKDIDFFYQQVNFEFVIENVSHELKENGELFFIVQLHRRLQGISVEGDSVNTVQERFIEINLDAENRLLKIASIYTSALSEKEALASWWNELSLPWKQIFADDIRVNDSLSMGELLQIDLSAQIGDTLYLLPPTAAEDTLRSSLSDLFTDAYLDTDTLILDGDALFRDLKRLLELEQLDLTPYPEINELNPLGRLTRLRRLNISGTAVGDLTPIRNLTRLEVLNCSYTPVNSLAPLRYATSLQEIISHHTFLQNLDALANFRALKILHLAYTPILSIEILNNCPNLEELDISYTRVNTLVALSSTPKLEKLKITGTPVSELVSLQKLEHLATLYIDHSPTADLSPLAGCKSLRLLFCEGTEVSDLSPLAELQDLRKIYCDMTQVGHEEANRFMARRPEVLVIYESAALQMWWQYLPSTWKQIFFKTMKWEEEPSREDLAELSNITRLDISDKREISSLEPLQQLTQIAELNCSNTGIESLSPLRDLVEMRVLILSETLVEDLEPLNAMRDLRALDLSGTAISTLSSIQGLTNLEQLLIRRTILQEILVLKDMSKLRLLDAEESGVGDMQVKQLLSFLPDLLVIYRTEELNAWWEGLDSVWQLVFRERIKIDLSPYPEQLHSLTSLDKIVFKGLELTSLEPLRYFLRLEEISFSDTRIADLSPLADMQTLQRLNCPRNPIADLSSLSSLGHLIELNLQNTPVDDLLPISNCKSLETLNISATSVKNLKALGTLTHLKGLDCSSTDVGSLKAIESLTALRQLICYNTRLSERKVNAFKLKLVNCEVVFY